MARKKDFSTVDTERVYNALEESLVEEPQEAQEAQETQEEPKTRKARREYTEEEQKVLQSIGKTMGRKGCKAVRVNMAFTPEIHDYITTMSRVRGETITEFTNYVFSLHKGENEELFKEAKEFLKKF